MARIGDFNRVITQKRATSVRSDYGQPVETFTYLREFFASVEMEVLHETREDRLVEISRVTLETHYFSDITTKDRLTINGIEYRISSVNPDKVWMTIQAIEVDGS